MVLRLDGSASIRYLTKRKERLPFSKKRHFSTGKTLLAMKLLPILFLSCFLHVNVLAFDQEITIKKENASLETVFREIEKQSPYRFFFNETLMKQARPVTIDVERASLSEALEACFKMQPALTYAIVEKTIIVKRREANKEAIDLKSNKFELLAEVRGTISNEKGPVSSATIMVKGTEKATSTNSAGEFVLHDVEAKATLLITHISHETQEIRLNGRGLLSILLSEKIAELDEQIVVAYNTSTKKSNVGAITVVKGEQVRDLPYRSVDKSLQGLVPGLLVTSGTGQPGGGLSNFVLRGIATGTDVMTGSAARNPLIVIDGIPVNQEPIQWNYSLGETSVYNPMAQLNPSDIESVSVLKDAAAIALYGSKASNGVILITTKKGKLGKATFSFRHQTDISARLKGKINVLNRQEYLDLLFETYRNTDPSLTDEQIMDDLKNQFPTKADGSLYPETDWAGLLYSKRALTISNEISMSGGTEKSNYYMNTEYTKQDGIYGKTGYDRMSIRFNFENRPQNWVKLGVNTSLSYNVQDYASILSGSYSTGLAIFNSPLNPAYLEDGSYYLNFVQPYEAANPLAAIEYNINRNTSYRGLTKIYGEFSFLKNFKLSTSVGIDFTLVEAKEKSDPRLFDEGTSSFGSGRIQERLTRDANLITTNMLRYDKLFGKDHTVNLLVGQEAQTLNRKFIEGGATDLIIPSYIQLSNGGLSFASGDVNKQTLLSYFSQANYGFQNKYFFTGSVRKDGSSRFGERNRYGTYWSAGLGWIITGEQFMKKATSWIDYIKLRGSIGSAGNSFAIDRFTRYDVLYSNIYLTKVAATPTSPGNLDIKWEQTFTWDAGLEAKFWNSRISLTADIYQRKTSDLIYSTNLPYTTGWMSISDNIGDMKNKGLEFSLSVDVIKNRNFGWNINANWSTNKNILVKANVPLAAISGGVLGNEEGRNFNSFYMIRWAGVDPADGSPQWIDSTGKANSSMSAVKKEFVGKPQPDGFGAINTFVQYKNFSLSASLYYQYGFQIYNSGLLTNDGALPYTQQDKRALDRWQKPGDIAANPKRLLYNFAAYDVSTRHLYDGDFIRLQNVSLSYNFPKKVVERLGLGMLRIYAQGHNLALWTKYPGEDPGNTNVQGSTSLAYPNQRTFSLGLNVNF